MWNEFEIFSILVQGIQGKALSVFPHLFMLLFGVIKHLAEAPDMLLA